VVEEEEGAVEVVVVERKPKFIMMVTAAMKETFSNASSEMLTIIEN
jgi:hypothetical protein